ncbi:hypothetical protein A1O3_10303 [Capronia epimyces CBS 606.96]|uniref:chitin synthase n=1 Tax=Capronia epimyces CBS 606.96 TaxID=1182542 RepID=W9XIG7_9EURO|nr:uncharacterized protein A1O3_10303 [Capronia epimyces CBS 606.96]EXJ77145.1 hypothetical protein A1O3_10303 [Capronia epimyces CBS 606.96]
MAWRGLINRFLKKREAPLLPIAEVTTQSTSDSQTTPDAESIHDEKSLGPHSAWAGFPTIAEHIYKQTQVTVTPLGTSNHQKPVAAGTDHVDTAVDEKENPFGDQYAISQTSTAQVSQQQWETSSQSPLLQPTAQLKNFSWPSYGLPENQITWVADPNTFPLDAQPPQGVGNTQGRPRLDKTFSSSALSTLSTQHSYPMIVDPVDPARKLSPRNLFTQRILFLGTVITLNVGCLMAALFSRNGMWVFVFILVIKSKDVLSAVISPIGMLVRRLHHTFIPPREVPSKWILSLIPAYSESEEQIVKCIFSLRDNGVQPHRQVMCVVLDGKERDVKSHYTKLLATIQRPYISFKHRLGELTIHAGFMEDVPVIVIEKKKNAGKKDSLILAHDLFNYPRENVPLYTQLLREELWQHVLPDLTAGHLFNGFDMVFCTDADSVIHQGALASLCNALARDDNSIAACGLVLVELEPGLEWSAWNMYQQFQYCFGQYVRRRAEHFWGKVTCLPGCITMIKCRPECAGAIAKYAEAVTVMPVLHHQVQYLGTDRRLTYSLLSQGIKLKTLFVPEAVSETVAPQSLQHYLSQRRRWGSNAYFNNYFYITGENMSPITRVAAFIEILRLSMVYYRFCNTVLLIRQIIEQLVHHDFDAVKLVPMLVVSQLPLMWFCASVALEKPLRRRAHKLLMGFCINKCVAPFVSMTVFWKVCRNVGSQVWGISGVTAAAGTNPASASATATATATVTAVTADGDPAVPAVPVVPAAPLVPLVAIVPAIPGAPALAAIAVPPAAVMARDK